MIEICPYLINKYNKETILKLCFEQTSNGCSNLILNQLRVNQCKEQRHWSFFLSLFSKQARGGELAQLVRAWGM